MRTIDATDKTSPTDRLRTILVGLLGLATLVCGTILYSQGGSFARWSEFQSIPETIN